jgi:hypothetical protein
VPFPDSFLFLPMVPKVLGRNHRRFAAHSAPPFRVGRKQSGHKEQKFLPKSRAAFFRSMRMVIEWGGPVGSHPEPLVGRSATPSPDGPGGGCPPVPRPCPNFAFILDHVYGHDQINSCARMKLGVEAHYVINRVTRHLPSNDQIAIISRFRACLQTGDQLHPGSAHGFRA